MAVDHDRPVRIRRIVIDTPADVPAADRRRLLEAAESVATDGDLTDAHGDMETLASALVLLVNANPIARIPPRVLTHKIGPGEVRVRLAPSPGSQTRTIESWHSEGNRLRAERDGWKQIAMELLRTAWGDDVGEFDLPPIELLQGERPRPRLEQFWRDLTMRHQGIRDGRQTESAKIMLKLTRRVAEAGDDAGVTRLEEEVDQDGVRTIQVTIEIGRRRFRIDDQDMYRFGGR